MTDPVPSNDLVENLKNSARYSFIHAPQLTEQSLFWLAAEEIERLQRRVAELNAECDRWADLSNARDDAKLRAAPEPAVDRCEHGNPIDPTGSYVCMKCFNSAKPVLPFTHWSKDPLIPYDGCTCSSCEEARLNSPVVTTSGGTAQPPVDVRDVSCPACGKPIREHKGDLGPGALLWCP